MPGQLRKGISPRRMAAADHADRDVRRAIQRGGTEDGAPHPITRTKYGTSAPTDSPPADREFLFLIG